MHPTDINRRFFYATPRHAATYDETIGWVAPLYGVLHDTILRLVADDVKQHRGPYYILDIGCGTGAESIGLLKAHRNIHLVAMDLSGAMLDELRKNLAKHGIAESRVDFIEGDILGYGGNPQRLKACLPARVRRRGFDAVISAFTLHHFSKDEKLKAYRRAHDCLAAGGLLLNGDLYDYEGESRFMTKFALEFDRDWIELHFAKGAKAERNEERRAELLQLGRAWTRHYFVDNTCHSVSRQAAMLRRIGFKQVATPFRYFQMGLLWARR